MMTTTHIEPSHLWPTVSEVYSENDSETVDWEMVSMDSSPQIVVVSPGKAAPKSCLKHCQSSPDFGGIGFDDETSSLGVTSIMSELSNSVVLVKENGKEAPLDNEEPVKVRRVPSFKDAVLLNAQEKEREEREMKEQQARMQAESLRQRRFSGKTKFVVKPIKRCTMSTPDLTSLPKVEENRALAFDPLGRKGFVGGGQSICDDGILGETDASDYYARKSHGSVAYKNGQRLRPDEAKRDRKSVV